jgi:hypothetical protein
MKPSTDGHFALLFALQKAGFSRRHQQILVQGILPLTFETIL